MVSGAPIKVRSPIRLLKQLRVSFFSMVSNCKAVSTFSAVLPALAEAETAKAAMAKRDLIEFMMSSDWFVSLSVTRSNADCTRNITFGNG